MKWNPVDYGEIQNIRVAPDKVWLPDIVLFNKLVIFFSNCRLNERIQYSVKLRMHFF